MNTVGSPYEPLYRLERRVRRKQAAAFAWGCGFTLLMLVVLHLALRSLGA